MADEADERSALLQNGHASEGPEVNYTTFPYFRLSSNL